MAIFCASSFPVIFLLTSTYPGNGAESRIRMLLYYFRLPKQVRECYIEDMNILQLVSSSRTSGAEKHVAVLSDRLHKRGHNVFAACPPGEWLPDQLRAA